MIVLTLVGGKNEKDFEWILTELGIKTVKTVNTGMFGNFGTLTYWLDISEKDDPVVKRRELASMVQRVMPNCMILYEHGDWNRIYILKRFRVSNTF